MVLRWVSGSIVMYVESSQYADEPICDKHGSEKNSEDCMNRQTCLALLHLRAAVECGENHKWHWDRPEQWCKARLIITKMQEQKSVKILVMQGLWYRCWQGDKYWWCNSDKMILYWSNINFFLDKAIKRNARWRVGILFDLYFISCNTLPYILRGRWVVAF